MFAGHTWNRLCLFYACQPLIGGKSVGYRERRSFDSGPRQTFKAVCSDCGKECDVPFKPTQGRPVYCQECYAKHRPPRRY